MLKFTGHERGDLAPTGTPRNLDYMHARPGAIVVTVFLLQLTATGCRAEDPSSTGPSGANGSPLQDLNRTTELGEAVLSQGEYEEALKHFLRADEMAFPELPNYVALPRVAEARCRLGDRATGQAILADLRCIIDVELGVAPCYVGPETLGAPGHPNPKLTPLCFIRMCGEIFLSYYEFPSEEQVADVKALRLELDRLKEICGDEPAG